MLGIPFRPAVELKGVEGPGILMTNTDEAWICTDHVARKEILLSAVLGLRVTVVTRLAFHLLEK